MIKLNNFSDKILKNIHFELKDNSNLIILGSNGAGKSTLAKVLCGITPSSITFEDTPINKLKERTKYINYIPAKLEIFDEYISVEEYLDLSRLETLLASQNMLKLLEIFHLRNKPCQQLSSGEQQLLMLCTAVLHNAKVTIFDEPTANLDPKKSRDIFSLLKSKLFQQKVIITHDLTLAYRLGYDVCYMDKGEIVFNGSSEAFFNETTLDNYFGSSVEMIDGFVVVSL